MGCHLGRDGDYAGKEEEEIIKRAEDTLGFTNLESKELDRTFHRFSTDFKMTDNQFFTSLEDINVDTKPIRTYDAASPICKFYDEFKDEENFFHAQRLTCLGILLGNGAVADKALVLFENYDMDTSKSISQQEFLCLLKDLVNISLVWLPKYAMELCQGDEKMKLQQYIEKLANIKDTLVVYLSQRVNEIDDEELSKPLFLVSFKDEEVKSLLQSHSLRKLALEKYNDLIAPATLVRAYMRDEHKFNERMKDPLFRDMLEDKLISENMGELEKEAERKK
ncbi:unnamed protein product [Blepharisma stoltei]|uniref:EF-hand domain-containing protein n=1 Tax=Blepharisma stoltei TaxID=1481888 RepID=A0AAU9JFJ6_9CILI|nr:unnamed protein product [Blepharisma stoltei]